MSFRRASVFICAGMVSAAGLSAPTLLSAESLERGDTRSGIIKTARGITLELPAPGTYRGEVKRKGSKTIKLPLKDGKAPGQKQVNKAKNKAKTVCGDALTEKVTVHYKLGRSQSERRDGQVGFDPKPKVTAKDKGDRPKRSTYQVNSHPVPSGSKVTAKQRTVAEGIKVRGWKWDLICPRAKVSVIAP